MKKQFLDVNKITLGRDGRVILGDEVLQRLEENHALPAGGDDGGGPVLTNNPDLCGYGLNLLFCDGTTNNSIICANGLLCRDTTNSVDCRNASSCDRSINKVSC